MTTPLRWPFISMGSRVQVISGRLLGLTGTVDSIHVMPPWAKATSSIVNVRLDAPAETSSPIGFSNSDLEPFIDTPGDLRPV